MSDSIKVAIKIRPLIKREKDENLPIQWEAQGNTIFSVDPETKRRGEHSHVFDHIFGMHNNNNDIYDEIVKPIVEASVHGFNGTIFAYGQTGSGKTHTMMGTSEEPGIIPLAIENMFDVIAETSGREFLLRVSYLEIYNEKVNDLLHKNGIDLKIHEDINGQVIVKCKEEVTNCPQNVLSIMKKGEKQRRTGETNMNERSSRSHTIFRITIESRETSSDADGAIQVSQLNLVDLAGSERVSQTGATGDRFKEGRHINLSLTTLSLVIMQLSESKEHVNFRDSKLTRILQASLGGNAMTTIICAVTPAALEETQSSLAFASRAKSVKNKPQINEVMSDAALLKRYSKQIAKLNAELEKERQTNRCAEVEKMESRLQAQTEYIQAIQDRMELLQTRIVSAANTVENVDFKTKSRRRRTWCGPSISGMLNHSMPLPTIQEATSTENTPSDFKKPLFKSRKSIIHTPLNEINESLEFQTEIADFEFDLMESARNWEMGRFSSDSVDLEDNYYVTKRRPGGNRITFQDEPSIYPISQNENVDISPAKSEDPMTPPRRHEEKDSGTPKEVLRERITHLVDEYTTLQEFTTLEKQLYTKEKPETNDSDNMEAMLNHMKKSVADSEMLCLETNKKYCDLNDKYLELKLKYETSVQENEALKKQVETFSCMEESLRVIESEKSQLKADMETKLRRLKKLEEERNDYQFQVELLESKYKIRQKELENSLQMAWKDTPVTSHKDLQSSVDHLTNEIEALRSKSEATEVPSDDQSLLMANETMAKKLKEYESTLKNVKNEKTKLIKKLEELEKELQEKSTVDRQDEALELRENVHITTNDPNTRRKSSQTLICDNHHDPNRLDGNESEELDEKNAVQLEQHNGIGTIVPDRDSTLQSIQLASEESLYIEITENSLSQKDCSMLSNSAPAEVKAPLNNLSQDLIQLEKLHTSSMADPGNESISELRITLGRWTLENENLVKENAYLKAQAESLVEEMKESKIAGIKLQQVTKELEDSLAAKTNVEEDLAKRDSKLQEIQFDIHKLKDHIVSIQSEKTLWEGEKCAMQKIINENAIIVQQIPKLKANIEDLELEKKEFIRTNHELRSDLNVKCLELEAIGTHKYEIELQNLKSYTADLEHLNKNIQEENEDLKYQLQNQSFTLENDLDDLKERITEQEKKTQSLEEDKKKLMERLMELSKIESERNVSVTTESPSVLECSEDKLSQDAKDDSSIFANYISFDEMEVSVGEDSTLVEQSTVNTSLTKAQDKSVTVAMLKRIIGELENSIKRLENRSTEPIAELSIGEDAIKLPTDEVINKLYDLMNIRTLLEDEKTKLAAELQLKIQESDEIKNDVQGLRLGIEKLEQTIHLLTTENMEMSNKLTVEKDRAKEADAAYQKKIEQLQSCVSEITEEKVRLANELKICEEHLDTLRADTPTGTEDEVRLKIEDYQKKIDELTTENINLSTELMDKIEEIDKIKENKSQDHGCLCKYEIQKLTEKLNSLTQENVDLSTDLMDKLEESESLKHAYELLEDKLAVSMQNQLSPSMNALENELIELRAENDQLKNRITDILPTLTILTNETDKLSSNNSKPLLSNESSQVLKNSDNSSATNNNLTSDESVRILKDEVEAYRLQVSQLTRLNKKPSDWKLSSCAQCNHLKELNDSRKTLKVEVRNLNDKLEDLQKKFEQKCADTDILRSKAREELNSSTIADVTLNGSMSESMNVSYVEEKMQSLNSELTSLKQHHEKLNALYKNKCSEVEKLNDTNLEESMTEQEPDAPAPNNNRARIERVQGDVDKLREEIQLLKKRNTALSQSLEKFINEKSNLQTEIETLKESKENLNTELKNSQMKTEKAYENVSALENEVTDLNKLVDSLRKIEQDTKNEKLKIEVEIEGLKTERTADQKTLEHLNTTLESERENNAILQKELKKLAKETAELRKENVSMSTNLRTQTNDCSKENTENLKLSEKTVKVEESQETIEDLKDDIAKLTEENASLIGQIDALQQNSITSKTELLPDFTKLEKELRSAKTYLSKEIRSLKPKVETSTLSDKTVNELLIDFLKIIMQKEQEIIKTVQERFEQEKQSLEDAKRQSINAERRVTAWAKELETDIEKLQSDLTQHEKQNVQLKTEIERMEHLLKESNHEKQLLKEKIEAMESEFNALQSEVAKQSDTDHKQGKEAHAIQEKERIALSFAKNREIELQNCIKSMKDQYNRELGELTFTLEQYKSKNFELKSNLEGLEANECQLKSIINLKSTDLVKLQQQNSVLKMENTQMSETCNQLIEDNQQKDRRIEEITNLVKIKCDKLSEYKTKLESILPEYEMLKEQINERKLYAEKYKNEYESFREKAGKELDLIKDKLSDERIKSSSLNEQLMELNGRNKLLLSELEELKSRCEDLEKSNEKLVNKMRNSTTNSRVEAQIEDLKDQNAVLQKSVEGASNRITELQESKNAVTKDLVSVQKKYEMLVEEKKELENIVGSGKTRLSSSDLQLKELRDKLEDQVQEKNKIALELEATKLAVSQKEKHLAITQEKIEELEIANKEFDEELDAQAKMIQDLIGTIEKLRNRIFDLENPSEQSSKNSGHKAQLQKVEYQNTKSSKQTSEVEIIIKQNKDLHEEIKTTSKKLDSLLKENAELKAKITDLESKREPRTCNSSRSSSPLMEDSRRKQRRSDLYNRGRSLDESSDASPLDYRCASLSQKVRELELEIVSKNGKIATLEMQIQSENFPYQKKCKDLEANLLAFKKKNGILKEEVKELQRAMSSISADECEICKKWQMNKRDQSTQCSVKNKTFMSGTSSGFVEDYARITKLEKEKSLMRDLCRSRTREIEELRKQISEYESLLSNKPNNDATVPIDELNQYASKSLTNREKPQLFGKNTKRAMKENLSSNILDNASAVPSYRGRSLWDNYP